jgi:hypothetical protein
VSYVKFEPIRWKVVVKCDGCGREHDEEFEGDELTARRARNDRLVELGWTFSPMQLFHCSECRDKAEALKPRNAPEWAVLKGLAARKSHGSLTKKYPRSVVRLIEVGLISREGERLFFTRLGGETLRRQWSKEGKCHWCGSPDRYCNCQMVGC